MLIKRLALTVISLALGYGITYLIVRFVGTTIEEYGPYYTFFTALSIALAIAIWLDKFMDTQILPK